MLALAVLIQLALFGHGFAGNEEKMALDVANDVEDALEKYQQDHKNSGSMKEFYATLSDDGSLLYQHLTANAPDKKTVDAIKNVIVGAAAQLPKHEPGTANQWVVMRDLVRGLMNAGGVQAKIGGLIATAVISASLREHLKTAASNLGEAARAKINMKYDDGTVKLVTTDHELAAKVNALKGASVTEMVANLRTVLPPSITEDKITKAAKEAFSTADGKNLGLNSRQFREAIFKAIPTPELTKN